MSIALLLPAVTAAVPSLGDRLVAGYFKQWPLPLTVSEATEANWTVVTGDPTACDAVSGRRFRFGELLTPTLVFDNMGTNARRGADCCQRDNLPVLPAEQPATF